MKRPSAINKIKDQQALEYISTLEAVVDKIQKDNNTKLYHSINKHMNDVIQKIDELTMDGEDEDMSRLTKYTKQAMEIEESLTKLRASIIPEELAELEMDDESTESYVMKE